MKGKWVKTIHFKIPKFGWGITKIFRRVEVPQPVVMYDSVDVTQIPSDAKAVAGYVGGHWPTFPTLARTFPHAHRLSIAVNASQDAECLDIETGDAVPGDAPAWVRRQHARGIKKPVVYASVDEMPAVLYRLAIEGIRRNEFRVWTAHYTFKEHRCTSGCNVSFRDTADATQFTDRAKGKNLDASICSPTFFG